MNSPMDNVRRRGTRENAIKFQGQVCSNGGGYLPRQIHVEATIADMPGNLRCSLGQHSTTKTLQLEPPWLGADHTRCTAIGKHKKRQGLFQCGLGLQMQSAELQVDHYDFCPMVGAYDVPRQLEAVKCCIAAHESQQAALDSR